MASRQFTRKKINIHDYNVNTSLLCPGSFANLLAFIFLTVFVWHMAFDQIYQINNII